MKLSIKRLSQSRIVMISGAEEALRRRTLSELLSTLECGPEDFDFESFLADVKPFQEWVGAASTVPFLSNYRTVVVRHLLRASEPSDRAKTVADLSSLPDTARLILVADDEAATDDNRQKTLASYRKRWEQMVQEANGELAVCDAESKALISEIRQEASQLGKQMSVVAATTLAEMTGASYSRALDELEKLAVYVGDSPEIRETDVREVATPSREWNVFKLVDSIVAGQASVALKQLRILVGSATKADEAASRNILPNMSRQFKLIWQARLCLDKGVTPQTAPESLKELFLDSPSLIKQSEWVQKKTLDAARKLSPGQIERCLWEIADADARLKGLKASHSAMEALELLVLKIVNIVQPKVLSS